MLFKFKIPPVLILWIMILVSLSGYTQSQKLEFQNYPTNINKEYFKSYLPVGKKIFTGPAHWNKKEWIIAGSVVAGGVVTYIFDEQIRQAIQSVSSPQLDIISRYGFEPIGDIYPFALAGGFYIYGHAAKNNYAKQIALGESQVIVFSILTTQLIKQLTHRHRPQDDANPSPDNWDGPFKGWGYNSSFPSTHTTLAFATATFFQQVYKDKLWVGILSYTLATGAGLSRIHDNKHWPTDVLIGAVLGYAIGKSVFNFISKDSRLSLGIGKYGGLAITYNID